MEARCVSRILREGSISRATLVDVYLDLIVVDNSCKAWKISSFHVWLQIQSHGSGIDGAELMLVVNVVVDNNLP